ncbi:glycosyltransferase [Peribacillus frigoritolerans]|uniref:glycosyltransferase n=1 Tax=Peribacillus frigoritolerans TaxID=450367 RepID=UPI001F4FF590|nr:glycosyltransferase [Peribacillus frigoritolerans]MCK2016879.1 glycosyltransferase [Peribacillus frigoritolerans]
MIKDKPVRVLHILTKLSFGGVQSVIMNYYRNLDRSKVQFDFVVQTEETGFFDEEVMNLGGSIFRVAPVHINKKQFETDLFDILTIHPEFKIVHVHQNFLNITALKIAKKAGVPVRISHSHSNYPTSSFITEIKRKVFRKIISIYATDFFACSKASAKWLYGRRNTMSHKCKIIHNAIQTENFKMNYTIRSKIRNELGVDGNLVLIHVGMITDAKNHEYLLGIFKQVQVYNKKSSLLIVGDGENKDNLMRISKEQGTSDSVFFLGKMENVNEYLMAADCFVFPSKFEGLGMALIEAQINGLHCWSSDVVPKEADIFGEVTFLSNDLPPDVWAKSIISCDPKRYTRNYDSISNSGYEIKKETDKLMEFYLTAFTIN